MNEKMLMEPLLNFNWDLEFGASLSARFWRPLQIKNYKKDLEIITEKSYNFPDSFYLQLTTILDSDLIKFCGVMERKGLHPCRIWMNTYMKNENLDYHFFDHKFDFSEFPFEKPFDKYICIIPSMTERWQKANGDISGTAGGRSVPFEAWLNYKHLANSKGYIVIGMGIRKETGLNKVDWKKLSDEYFYRDDYDSGNTLYCYLWEQLQILRGATFVLSLGGGSYIGPAFGFPSISCDANWRNAFPLFTRMHLNPRYSVLWDFPKQASLQENLKITDEFIIREMKRRL